MSSFDDVEPSARLTFAEHVLARRIIAQHSTLREEIQLALLQPREDWDFRECLSNCSSGLWHEGYCIGGPRADLSPVQSGLFRGVTKVRIALDHLFEDLIHLHRDRFRFGSNFSGSQSRLACFLHVIPFLEDFPRFPRREGATWSKLISIQLPAAPHCRRPRVIFVRRERRLKRGLEPDRGGI